MLACEEGPELSTWAYAIDADSINLKNHISATRWPEEHLPESMGYLLIRVE